VLDEAIRLGDQLERQICAGLSGGKRDQLLSLLRRVAANFGVGQETLPDRGTGLRPQPVPPAAATAEGDLPA
jgi:hypothetical protein